MSETLLAVLITSLTTIVTAVIGALVQLKLEQKKFENQQRIKAAKNEKEGKGKKEDPSSKDTVKSRTRHMNWSFPALLAFWKFPIILALIIGSIPLYILFKPEPEMTTLPAVPASTDVVLPTSGNTNTPIPVCPNAKVEALGLFVSPGKWNQYYPDQNGKINLVLSKEELGTLTELSGVANLINAGNCSCAWRGSLQSAPFEPIDTLGDCRFSINISSPSGKTTRVNLELTIGNNQPILFTISLP